MVTKKTGAKSSNKAMPAKKTPKASKPKKQSKAEIIEEKARLYDQIRAKEKDRRKLAARVQELKDECKEARQALGYCETEICGLGHALDENRPLFDQPTQTPAGPPKSNVAEKPKDASDDWKALPIGAAGIVDADAGRLLAAGLTTLGDLQTRFAKLDAAPKKSGDKDDAATVRIREKFDAFLKSREKSPAPSVPSPKKDGDDSWKLNTVAAAGFNEKQTDALEAAGLRTLGELQTAMNRHGQFWAKNTGVSGRLRQAIEDIFNAYVLKFAQSKSA
jgi:hypothetical protein